MRGEVRAIIDLLMNLSDKELADALEHVIERRCHGIDESFSGLTPYERLLLQLKSTVKRYRTVEAR